MRTQDIASPRRSRRRRRVRRADVAPFRESQQECHLDRKNSLEYARHQKGQEVRNKKAGATIFSVVGIILVSSFTCRGDN
jgi:hypothetical protein